MHEIMWWLQDTLEMSFSVVNDCQENLEGSSMWFMTLGIGVGWKNKGGKNVFHMMNIDEFWDFEHFRKLVLLSLP